MMQQHHRAKLELQCTGCFSLCFVGPFYQKATAAFYFRGATNTYSTTARNNSAGLKQESSARDTHGQILQKSKSGKQDMNATSRVRSRQHKMTTEKDTSGILRVGTKASSSLENEKSFILLYVSFYTQIVYN